ncbi:ParB N-terminal domain-containing protein [Streptomyces sp. NPDC005892]|uniref:ParB N-terminal domain-containing protein n=1 Tax=Streptomyces sp. NPDC005892 TaxID=3155593 RepID=UPI0033C6FBDD
MLSEDELHDLAESIRREGLHEPIVRDADGVLLDGRNRLAACELAGVEPRFITYSGTTGPEHLILGSNLRRRHISKGQRAMITEMSRSLSERSLRDHAQLHNISLTRLANAAMVLKHAPELAEQVRTGELGLDSAYRTVHERKAHAAAVQARYDHLSRHAPDLAAGVAEDLLNLDAAIKALEQRREEEPLRRHVQHVDALRLADGDTAPPLGQLVEQKDITWRQAHQEAERFLVQRTEAIHRAQQAIEQLAVDWPAIRHPETPYAREIVDGLSPQARTLLTDLTARA